MAIIIKRCMHGLWVLDYIYIYIDISTKNKQKEVKRVVVHHLKFSLIIYLFLTIFYFRYVIIIISFFLFFEARWHVDRW